jgi:hypothetical protein
VGFQPPFPLNTTIVTNVRRAQTLAAAPPAISRQFSPHFFDGCH